MILGTLTLTAIFYSFLKTTRERSREIGTLMSIGFSRFSVVAIFIAESTLLGIAGVVAAIPVTLLVANIINAAQVTNYFGGLNYPVNFGIGYDFWIVSTSAVAVVCVCIFGAGVAVWSRTKVSLADNLRFV